MNICQAKIQKNIFSILFLVLFFMPPVLSMEIEKYYDPGTGKTTDVAKGEVLVKFKSAGYRVLADTIRTKHGISIKSALLGGFSRYKIETNDKRSVGNLIEELKSDPDVEYAGPNHIVKAFSTVPNDTYYSSQWGPKNISCEAAWDIEKGSASVVIAIIDTGVLLTHPDLQNKVIAGYNFVDNNTNPTDLNGHGTHVSGIAAAQTNNLTGIAGVAWNCKIMPVRVLDASGEGYDSDVISGIEYAADNGAKVLNMSLGSESSTQPMYDAIQYAYGKGCVIVAAAGNTGDSTWSYPASYDNVLSVSALDRNNNIASYSSFNSHVSLSAPGGEAGAAGILSCYLSNGYAYDSGTSMAAPFVSGLAALIFSQHPAWTNAEVMNQLISSADDRGTTGKDNFYGYGEINAYKALNTVPAVPAGLSSASVGGYVNLSWDANSDGDIAGYKIYRCASLSGAYSQIAFVPFPGTQYSDLPGEGTFYYKISAFDLGSLESAMTNTVQAVIDLTVQPVPTINPVVSPTNLLSVTISGTKSAGSISISVNGSSCGVSILSSTIWSYSTSLSAGSNIFTFKAINASGIESGPVTVEVIQKALNYSNGPTGTSVEVPIGSSDDTAIITVETYSDPGSLGHFPTARMILGNAVDLVSNISSFTAPITITIKIPDGAIDPQPYFWDPNSLSWSSAGLAAISRTADYITFSTTHLCIYAVFGISGNITSVLIYPNPFRIGSSQGINFNGLSGNETIKIYTISGELVRAFVDQGQFSWIWDATNSAGNTISRGIYIFVITNNSGQKRTGKLAVLN